MTERGQDMESEQAEVAASPEHVRILPALRASLADAKLAEGGLDAGAVALSVRYAELLDDAKAAEKFTKALRLCGEAVSSYADELPITAAEQLMSAWDRITAALAEHSVASDLGPKLLASLTALGLTPAGRNAVTKGAAAPAAPAPVAELSPLQKARERAARRNGVA